MNVFCLQFDIAWEQKNSNHQRVLRLVDRLAPPPGSLLLLPEMFATGFSMNVEAVSDAYSHESQGFLSELARMHRVFVAGGVVGRSSSGGALNQCVVYDDDGEEVARYSKMRTFTPGGESDHYESGHSISLFEWQGFLVAPFICYDLRFPELFRDAMRQGATLFTVMASWPAPRIEHWTVLARARAIENQAYLAACNRSGDDPVASYPGRSLIVDPLGKVISEAAGETCAVGADVDPAVVDTYRRKLPFLCDDRERSRRPSLSLAK